MRKKTRRNDDCPCLSGKKYERCCLGKTDWNSEAAKQSSFVNKNLSIRGKNIFFFDKLAGLLQLNNLSDINDWGKVKDAFSDKVIREIHEYIPYLWQDLDDWTNALERTKDQTGSLYIGDSNPEGILRGVTRHSLYSDTILIYDPIHDHRTVKQEKSPIENPGYWRMTTIKFARLWLKLAPWIDDSLILFIRNPTDYSNTMWKEFAQIEQDRLSEEEFESTIDRLRSDGLIDDIDLDLRMFKEFAFLCTPNEDIVRKFLEINDKMTELELQQEMKLVEARRRQHPYYMPSDKMRAGPDGTVAELMVTSKGANYETAKFTSNICGAHIITDARLSWEEIKYDRIKNNLRNGDWDDFALTFQQAPIRVLNNIPLPYALKIRSEGRLEDLRRLFRTVWRKVQSEERLSSQQIQALADELVEKINEAESEWKDINLDLYKYLASVGAATVGGSASAIQSGFARWFAAGAAIATAGGFGYTWLKKRKFPNKYPAAMLLALDRKTKES